MVQVEGRHIRAFTNSHLRKGDVGSNPTMCGGVKSTAGKSVEHTL